ncbi:MULTISPECIES: NUDIX domain-containing protein [Aequorivita]|uniref:NUDIX domain-containing protein n=1 Tax=Aequorivita iocasae TaxID=2803865 RepID=A0ABX7DRJ9_9FLAO|nr:MULTISPECIES: NUDIX domain-containing protein [Aequorivita]QQX76178.1 NUDIX domain-containing protein [Aequorivita iocasae]UCA55638.1 NUDIX domain-containing protein [Aequorivita sp. F7]
MPKESAGLLLYALKNKEWKVLLCHPGGPFWAKKDVGAWTIPKGEIKNGENIITAALRETKEELGIRPQGDFIQLTPVKQKGGKVVHALALEKDFDPNNLQSNKFSLEWPPKNGKLYTYPEIDKVAWFNFAAAKTKILEGQLPFINELEKILFKNSNPSMV